MSEATINQAVKTPRWAVGGRFVQALATRDFTELEQTLAPQAHLRALLPTGPEEVQGAPMIAAELRSWFGASPDFELLDSTVSQVGGRLHLSWMFRVRPAPFDIGEGWHVIHQQAFADGDGVIESIDLLCSGFNAEDGSDLES